MALVDTISEAIRDYLPAGPFWRDAEAEKFVRGLARGVAGTAQLVDGLRDAIFPATADRPVLLQWWEFLRADCTDTPTDTEVLRARVLAILGAAPAYTFSGLAALVGSYFPTAELRHNLTLSSIPASVPFPVDPNGRVLEIWYSPLLEDLAQMQCLIRQFAQAVDVLRFVAPDSQIVDGPLPGTDLAIHWQHGRDGRLEIEAIDAGDGVTVLDSATWPLPTDTGAEYVSAILPGGLPGVNFFLVWYLERDIVATPYQITATQTSPTFPP
jgi:hypothetical protein